MTQDDPGSPLENSIAGNTEGGGLCKQKKWKAVISWRSASPSSLWETDKTRQKSGLSQYVSPTTYPSLPVQHGLSRQAFNTFSDAVSWTPHTIQLHAWPQFYNVTFTLQNPTGKTISQGTAPAHLARERDLLFNTGLQYCILPLTTILCKIWCLYSMLGWKCCVWCMWTSCSVLSCLYLSGAWHPHPRRGHSV